MHLDYDSALAAVVDFVREVHTPIDQAITDGKPVTSAEFAALSGAVSALLDAMDARVAVPVSLREAVA